MNKDDEIFNTAFGSNPEPKPRRTQSALRDYAELLNPQTKPKPDMSRALMGEPFGGTSFKPKK